MRRGHRIAAVGLAAAVVAGLSGAAMVEMASAAPAAPTGKSTASIPPDRAKSGNTGELDKDGTGTDTAALAGEFGVPQAKLERALDDAKRVVSGLAEGGRNSTWLHPAVVAVVARDLGVSPTAAIALLKQLPWFGEGVGGSKGQDKSKAVNEPVPAAVVTDVARSLRVSDARVRAALQRLSALWASGGSAGQTDPGFVAVARSLGVSPQMLENALRTAKQHLAATGGEPGTK